ARTAQADQLRVRLAEFGVVVPQGMARLMSEVKMQLADNNNELPLLMRDLAQRLVSHLQVLDRQVQEVDNQIRQLARQSGACRTLEQVPGIGPITATALVATVGDSIG